MKPSHTLLSAHGRQGALLGSLALVLASCTTITTFGSSDGTDGEAESGDSGGIIPTASTGVPSSESDSTTGTSSSGGADSSGEVGNSFLNASTSDSGLCGDVLPDGVVGHSTISCSVIRQDCCPGDACRAWANDGGGVWNSTRCVPVDPDAGSAGDLCQVEGSDVTGLDSCGIGLMCWEVDPDTLEGTCIEYCSGTSDDPVCSNADDVCGIANDGVLALCLPGCDLLLNDCDGDGACIEAENDAFGCIDERYTRCPAGTTEIHPSFGLDCGMDEPCCSPYCDLTEEAPCGPDLLCAPLSEPYVAYPDIGACATMLEQ